MKRLPMDMLKIRLQAFYMISEQTVSSKAQGGKRSLRQGSLSRTLALIVSAHPYCARKFTCIHVMHRARALNTKLNNNKCRWPLLLLCLDLTTTTTTTTFIYTRKK